MPSDDLATRFERAKAEVMALPVRPDNDTLLRLYALYKQGLEGDAKGERPGFFDFVGNAKYESWEKLKGMKQDEAMKKYIELVETLVR